MNTLMYTDGIQNISLVDGIVRCQLMGLSPQGKGKDMLASPVGTLVMSVPALLRTHQQLSAMMEQLVAQGVLQKQDPQNPSTAVPSLDNQQK